MVRSLISQSAENRILNINGVTSVGRGMVNGQDAIIIGVESQRFVNTVQNELQSNFGQTVEGVQYDVQVTGRFRPEQITLDVVPQQTIDPARTSRFRPIPMGVSIGHFGVTAGTSSHLMTDGENIFPSSNNHVIARNNQASPGDNIIQPGSFDDGRNPEDKVGELRDYVPVEDEVTVDFAWMDPVGDFNLNALGISEDVGSNKTSVQPGDTVVKTGRTTGVTSGEVSQVDASVPVQFPDGVITFTEQIITENMSEPGDSGSPVYAESNGQILPAGILFAGSDNATVICTAANMEQESGLQIVPMPAPGPPPEADIDLSIAGLGVGTALGGALLRELLGP